MNPLAARRRPGCHPGCRGATIEATTRRRGAIRKDGTKKGAVVGVTVLVTECSHAEGGSSDT